MNYRSVFNLTAKEAQITELEQKTAEPDFWSDEKSARELLEGLNRRRKWVSAWKQLEQEREDLATLLQLAQEEDDSDTFTEVTQALGPLEKKIEELEFRNILGGEDDPRDAILTIHSGAGGTESMDWTQMLLRMYLRWMERQDFQSDVLDLQPGDGAGIKSVTVDVRGEYAYGYLKTEVGVHRLVRISPFDSQSRRHTSFASVFVYSQADEKFEVEINERDIRTETFRASGPGGQNVNKVNSAVRITHLPTGITVQCQSERSQHQNRENAMRVLTAQLYQRHKEEEEQKRLKEIESKKKSIEWGSQIRSYVMHPYNLVKDHRTGAQTGNVQAVMDGEIDEFIRAYLLHSQSAKD